MDLSSFIVEAKTNLKKKDAKFLNLEENFDMEKK